MNLPREQIYSALFATLQSALGAKFATISRRWRMPEQVSPESRPALFQVQTGERAKTNANGEPIIWIATVDLVIYTQGSGDEQTVPSQELNDLLDAVEAALAPPPNSDGKQTLGGKVSHCRLQGSARIVENVNGAAAMAVVPVEILTAA
ncbi:MAG TPA: hypothetical protein VFU50_11915 [Terriglobales bacterium]|nr:hypothetical protein [Terriglobales bacterium]